MSEGSTIPRKDASVPGNPGRPGVDTRWIDATRRGDHALAWSLCEQALAERDPATRDDPRLPYHLRWVWDGTPVDGRDVLVRCYHGLGDTIQFARYLPLLHNRAASVTVEIQPRLIALFTGFPGIDRLVPFDVARPLPPAECDLEIMELGFALRAAPGSLPPPYLHAAPAELPSGTVGLCCLAGDWDPERAIPPRLLAGLGAGRPLVTLDPEPSVLPVLNPAGCPFDMPGTAALVAAVDLVVTVDTMIAHLAGAMGKPTWLLLRHQPDWRWTPDAGGSEWYPSMKLFAQPRAGDWHSVAARVERHLAGMSVDA
jgi:hypothetical protein